MTCECKIQDMPAELQALLQAAEEWELAHAQASRSDYETKERILRVAIQDWRATEPVSKWLTEGICTQIPTTPARPTDGGRLETRDPSRLPPPLTTS